MKAAQTKLTHIVRQRREFLDLFTDRSDLIQYWKTHNHLRIRLVNTRPITNECMFP